MINQQQKFLKSRLGLILIKGTYISQLQLERALGYQSKRKIKLGTALLELKLITRKQLNAALRKQSWTRAIAASIAIICAPFSNAMASDQTKLNTVNQKIVQNSASQESSPINAYTTNIYFSAAHLDQQSRDFYYSGKNDDRFSIKKRISDQSGMQFSLFSTHPSGNGAEVIYEFDPQISLFKSSSKPNKISYIGKRIGKGMDRYSNTKPVVFMLTLKGRCLFENTGKETKMWSMERAKQGVQQKAELMFSITKQF